MNNNDPKQQSSIENGKKKGLSYDLLVIGVISLLAVGSWVTFEVYRATVKTTLPRVLQRQIRPLKAKINPETMDNLKQRRQFEPGILESVIPRAPKTVVDENKTGRESNFGVIVNETATPSATPTTLPATPNTVTPVSTNSADIAI